MAFTINGTSGINLATQPLTGSLPDANAPSGSVLQVVNATLASSISTTSTSYVDTGLSVSITPSSSTSKILIQVCLNDVSKNDSGLVGFNIQRNGTTLITPSTSGWGTTNQVFYTFGGLGNSRYVGSGNLTYLDSPATTSSLTYKVQYKVEAGTGYLNQWGLNTDSSSVSFITVMEIAA